MDVINEFEKDTRKLIRTLNKEDLITISKNENIAKKYFKDPNKCLILLNAIIEKNENIEIVSEITTIKYQLILNKTEIDISKHFYDLRENNISRNDLLKIMEDMRNDKDAIISLSAYLCSLIALKDINLQNPDKLIANIKEAHNIVNHFGDIKNAYEIICNIVDLIYEVNTEYFNQYQKDILELSKEKQWLNELCDKLHNFEDEILEFKLPEIDVKPEELGLIDITDFGKEKKDAF